MNEKILTEIREKIISEASGNPRFAEILRKVGSGNANFTDTAEYSNILSRILGRTFSERIPEITETGMREYICTQLLRDNYENINEILAQVQTSLDKPKGINIAPQKAKFPEERVQKIAGSLEDTTVPEETVQRRADSSVANVARSFHDDYMKKNAEFRSNAGLKCYLERETDGKCCPWCSALAGRYLVGEQPADIFRRHDNCCCTVVLIDGKTRQYAWSKKTWSREEEREYLKNLDAQKKAKRLKQNNHGNTYSPAVIHPDQAKELQSKNLPKVLTGGANGGIIEETSKKPITPITDKAIEQVPKVKINGYTDEQSSYIQKQHKELLDYSRKNNSNKEVAFVFDSNLANRREFTGADDRLDFGTALYGKDLFVMHNHPRNSSYSFNDIVEFIGNDSIKVLSIVKNNGLVESLSKLSEYNRIEMLRELQRLEKNNIKTGSDSEYRKIVNKFLNKHVEGGFLQWQK